MITNYCAGCNLDHEDSHWKFRDNEWICQKWYKPTALAEFIPDRIRKDREKYKKDLIQPWRGDQLSKEFIDTYGTKNIKATPDQIKKAKNVWS